MFAKNTQKAFEARRNGQSGAALLTCLLISTMLLGIAGMVILTTGMSATTSVESSAEMQAYYGAEAGLEASLNVLRGNVAPRAGLPLGTRIGFRNAVQLDRSNLPTDTSAVARLSGWLPYDASGRVVPAGTNFAYNVTVVDPDDWDGAKMAADANYSPTRLLVRANGFGPRNATKRMEMAVTRVILNFKTVAALAMRSADDNVSTMTFTLGSSNAKVYSGHDYSGTQPALPSVAVTGAQDVPVAEDAITKGSTVVAEQVKLVPVADLPEFLQTADNARAFLTYMQSVSYNLGRYYTSFSGYAGTSTAPKMTFVNGDCNLDGGAGLLLVTGKLTMNGNPNFDGIILVMGDGNVERDGAGNGNTLGTIYVARFARSWPSSENGDPHPFLAPTFITNGAGNMDLRYDSPRVRMAENVMGCIVRDVREY
jgi:hypothetical protein